MAYLKLICGIIIFLIKFYHDLCLGITLIEREHRSETVVICGVDETAQFWCPCYGQNQQGIIPPRKWIIGDGGPYPPDSLPDGFNYDLSTGNLILNDIQLSRNNTRIVCQSPIHINRNRFCNCSGDSQLIVKAAGIIL